MSDSLRNTPGVALAAAARTATTTSPNLDNPNGRAIWIWLNVTAASGTGGLQVQVFSVDPVSGATVSISGKPTAISATGCQSYLYSPSAESSGNAIKIGTNPIPRTFQIVVTHGDASSYTYSVGYCLLV